MAGQRQRARWLWGLLYVVADRGKSSVALTCGAGSYAANGGACVPCPAGTASLDPNSTSESSCERCPPGFSSLEGSAECQACLPGRISTRSDTASCQQCPAGTFAEAGASTACRVCPEGRHAPLPGSFLCAACLEETSTPAGAIECCPNEDGGEWPAAGALAIPPGRGSARVYHTLSCQDATGAIALAADSAALPAFEVSSNTFEKGTCADPASGRLCFATLHKGLIHDCVELNCGDASCSLAIRSGLVEAGERLTLQASVGSSGGVGDRYASRMCPTVASLVLDTQPCDRHALRSYFLFIMVWMAVIICVALAVEADARHRVDVLCECSLDIHVPMDVVGREATWTGVATLPTEAILRESVGRGIQLVNFDALPCQLFSAWVSKCHRSDLGEDADAPDHVLHVEFAINLPVEERDRRRRHLLRTTWTPHRSMTPWAGARVDSQLPKLTKLKGCSLDDDVVDLVERGLFALVWRCFPSALARPSCSRGDLHAQVARDLLAWLQLPRALAVVAFQYVCNVAAAVILPVYAASQMTSCEDGYPQVVHWMWLLYLVLSVFSNVALLCTVCRESGAAFLRRFILRVCIRIAAMCLMSSDTYQDCFFLVLTKACHLNISRVSLWLVFLGIGVMQVCLQPIMLLRRFLQYRNAKSPEERERISVEGIFEALRGSDNFLLGYAVAPALQERLGGLSSWARSGAEARIALIRVVFQDVQQAAIQMVFLVFLEDARSADKVVTSFSVVTSSVISCGLMVHCLPHARDWLWHRALTRFPGGRRLSVFRAVWFALGVSIYKVGCAFPWISSCSGAGEVCSEQSTICFGLWCCEGARRTLLGLPARQETLQDFCWWSLFGTCGLVLAGSLVALVSWARKRLRRRQRLQILRHERYDPDRLAAASGENMLRPRLDADDDNWLELARQLVGISAGVRPVVEAADQDAFLLSRARPLQRTRALRKAENRLPKIIAEMRSRAPRGDRSPDLARGISRLCGALERARRLAKVRRHVAELLSSRSFLQVDIREKSAQILESTDGFAPLRLVHWKVLKERGELPRAGATGGGAEDVEDLLHRVSQQMPAGSTSAEAASLLVPFFLSHRWLRIRGPRSGHHPDSLDGIKAKQLVAFAEWFMACNEALGHRCEVAFWIDWCCADQDNPDIAEVHAAALPLYIAACSKVVAWQTPDFERRCWLMVERLLAYCFSPGGLKPFVINETSFKVGKTLEDARRIRGGGDRPTAVGAWEAGGVGGTTISRPVWQVWLNSDWHDYDAATQARLFEARQNGQKKVALAILGRDYEIDVVAMKQKNVKTRLVRHVREHMSDPVLLECSHAVQGDESVSPLTASVIGKPTASVTSSYLLGRRKLSAGANAQLQYRARKLSDPLDFESHRVTTASDRRSIAQLVDVTLAVPVLEVFADRQPVEFGLTEVVEQSLVNNIQLPSQWQGRSPPPPAWLTPANSERSDWRIVVRDRGDQSGSASPSNLLEHADALTWIDFGYTPCSTPPTPGQINLMFDAVDRAFAAGSEDLIWRSKALIAALMADLTHSMGTGEEIAIYSAIFRCRDVDLPGKHQAHEFVSARRLREALASDEEASLRQAVDMASSLGCEHLKAFKEARARQQELAQIALGRRLRSRLSAASSDRDIEALIAVEQVAEARGLEDIVRQACAEADAWVAELASQGTEEQLAELHRTAEGGGWQYLATRAAATLEEPGLVALLDDPSTRDDLTQLRVVERRARALKLTALVERATTQAKHAAGRINTRMGLPPEWDVVQEQHGQQAKLLLKTEELDPAFLQRIQELVNNTFRGWGSERRPRTRDRPPGQLVAIWLEVRSVVYVQNAEYFLNYRDRLQKISEEMPARAPRGGAWDIKTGRTSLAGVGRHSRNPLNPNCNEVYLWHGTSPEGANGITDTEFDLRRAGKATGKFFGPGIYLAESCLKADEYTKPDHRGLYPLVLCRTSLGNINYCAEELPQASLLAASCRQGNGYHSILGDRQAVHGTFREFIVYDKHQVYPEYIVWYARRWFRVE